MEHNSHGFLPTGDYLFVVIDAYSRFHEVEIVHSTSAATIIPKMDKNFCNTWDTSDCEEQQRATIHKQ